jgi:hypothetical protein
LIVSEGGTLDPEGEVRGFFNSCNLALKGAGFVLVGGYLLFDVLGPIDRHPSPPFGFGPWRRDGDNSDQLREITWTFLDRGGRQNLDYASSSVWDVL